MRRYEFLRRVAERHDATIATAHHEDDVVETIAINLTRGTGWRGLAVLNSPDVVRPLLKVKKSQLYEYALKRGLEWVEDETNLTDAYLRNRLRSRLSELSLEERQQVLTLIPGATGAG
jgi:tRNA(Ile)-lysidine synthase